MILKERKEPIKLLQVKMLLMRAKKHPSHPKIKVDYAKRLAGYKGERNVDYYLKFLPSDKFDIFHDVTIKIEGMTVQIDTLIISLHVIFILEVKNIAGTLYFDQRKNQLIRTYQSKEEVLPNPFLQVKRQAFLFKRRLESKNINNFQVENFIVISNPYTILKTNEEDRKFFDRMVQPEAIVEKIVENMKRYEKIKSLNNQLKKHIPC
ncbi:nuclease-related domain-containing protein [Niallia sp. 01092]|uniref:nuclease-related domain-containing protein n=1 Tax=unclassified Niallia TaxID=2837522 RepID=UPI003FD0B4D0